MFVSQTEETSPHRSMLDNNGFKEMNLSVIVKKVLVCKTVNLLIYSILTFLLAQEKLTMKVTDS